jgi:UDP-N-acetylenolpyruvoylglucosamine reductase
MNTVSEIIDVLKQKLPNMPLSNDISWKKLTTLGVGTGATILAEPGDDLELGLLLKCCHQLQIPCFVLGNGSNVVGTDGEFNGVVIRLRYGDFVKISPGRAHMTAGAGIKLNSFIRFAAEHGWGGMAKLAGIPGSIGGAVRMNAGANGMTVGDMILEVFGFTLDGTPWAASYENLEWKYRGSNIPPNAIITGAIFKLNKVDPAQEEELIHQELRRRKTIEPDKRNAGCAFKNPSHCTHAGRLIDKAGCKDMQKGDAAVYARHANYLLNHGDATEADFVALMQDIVARVYDDSGIILRPEVDFISNESRNRILDTCAYPTVAVLKGGDSSERAVSLESGAAVAAALRQLGYPVEEIDLTRLEITDKMRSADVVFPVLHGGFGENGELQKLMEAENISFVGCGSKACADTIDKLISKEIMLSSGLPTPAWTVLSQVSDALPEGMSLSLICKPPSEGSTFGISLVHNMDEWREAQEQCLKYDTRILVEEYIQGSELTVGVVNDRALTPVEIVYPGEMYDYDAKYTHEHGETHYYCPPVNVSEAIQKTAMELALKFSHAVDARDMIRIDFIADKDGKLYILEGNTIPGFTSSSLLPKAAAYDGLSFEMLCAQLIASAWRRKKANL